MIAGFAKAIDDFAQVRFVDSENLRHSVLAEAARVDFQLQIRINVTLNCHGMSQ
jgi:hypothetical protein